MKAGILYLFLCAPILAQAQNVGIGTNTPTKKLSINGSVMIDAENKSSGTLDSAALLFGNTGKVGIAADKITTNTGGLDFFTNGLPRIRLSQAGQVSINTSANYIGYSLVSEGSNYLEKIGSEKIGSEKITVGDTLAVGFNLLRVENNIQGGHVKVGAEIPGWSSRFQVNGDVAIANTTNMLGEANIGANVPDGQLALRVFSDALISGDVTLRGTNPTMQIQQGFNNTAFLQLSGDNLRMGTNSGNAAGKFIIRNNGGDRVTVDAAGNMDVQGDITANGNKGILINSHGAGQLKYYTRTVTANTSLAAGAMSGEITVGLAAGVFSSPPKVFAGDIVSTGGASGELLRTQLVIYGVTTTSCKVRVINNSNTTINYSTVWNIVCVGE